MRSQLSLFQTDGENKTDVPNKHKRVRYAEPTYRKFYSVIQYDRKKFRRILNMKLNGYKCLKDLTQDDILKLCYIKDEGGRLIYDSDEKHIYRYATLQRLYNILYNYTAISPFEKAEYVKIHRLNCWVTEQQAEIDGTCYLPLGERVRIYIRLLRLLKAGIKLKEALSYV